MDEKVVVIDRLGEYYQAQLAKDRLEAEGIECFIGEVNTGNFTGGYKLNVKESDRAKAVEVLSRMASENNTAGENA